MKSEILYEREGHKWVVLGRDEAKPEQIIDTNEYAIITDEGTLLPDPGGIEIFPRVLSELTRFISPEEVKVLFASHQDPDIISSLPMWLDLCPNATTHVSWMWTSFISHFAIGRDAKIVGIPDEGQSIALSDSVRLQAVPAHYCHSSGCFSLYDPEARILFSGDIGAAFLPGASTPFFVEDFDAHVELMRGFHRRWMPSSTALRAWTRRVRSLEPNIIAPQHGSIFRGPSVYRFLDWLDSLEVGQVAGQRN